jgi:diguanylate cyclase (GGDEF)-like protein
MLLPRRVGDGRSVRLSPGRLSALLAAHAAVSAVAMSSRALQRELCEQALALVGGDGALIELRDDAEMEVIGAAGAGRPHVGLRRPFVGSISGRCTTEGAALVCTDTESDPRADADTCRRLGARSLVLAPLRDGDGVVGVLEVFAGRFRRYSADDAAVLALLAAPFGPAVVQARRMTAAVDGAGIDPLTGLNNRAQALRDLERARLRQGLLGGHTAVLFVDLDGFSLTNDLRGTDVGNTVLAAVGTRIALCVRERDTAARFGGDRFLVICEQVATDGDAIGVAERLVAEMNRPYLLPDGEFVEIGVSIGVAVTSDDIDPQVLVQAAEGAMQRAKRRGGGYVTVRVGSEPVELGGPVL